MNPSKLDAARSHVDRSTFEAIFTQIDEALSQKRLVTFFVLKLAKRIETTDNIDKDLIPRLVELITKLNPEDPATQQLRLSADCFLTLDDIFKHIQTKNPNLSLDQIEDPQILRQLTVFPGMAKMTAKQLRILRDSSPKHFTICQRELIMRRLIKVRPQELAWNTTQTVPANINTEIPA